MAATRRINVSGAIARYRTARTSLHTPGSRQSRYGLDWMNFFIADVQTGFGTFVAFYLARLSWSQQTTRLVIHSRSLARFSMAYPLRSSPYLPFWSSPI